MKTYYFHIKRTHKDAWEPFQIDAPNSAAAVAGLPLCVDWDFRMSNGRSMTTPVQPQQLRTRLKDCEDENGTSPEVVIDIAETMIQISVEGYGAWSSVFGQETNPGDASIASLELCQGNLRFLLWPDINDEEPDLYPLMGAVESLRKPEE